MTESFAMRGLEPILRMLDALQGDALTAAAEDGLTDGLTVICEEAKALCPRDTGALQASIRVRMTGSGGEVVAGAPYAAAVELGSLHRAAQPFLFPAMRARQAEALDGVQRAVQKTIREGDGA